MTTAGHALLPILSCQNVTKFETFDVYTVPLPRG